MAIRMGKLPRHAGLTLVREGEQYELTLKSETFAVTQPRFPRWLMIPQCVTFLELRVFGKWQKTVDLLFEVFCKIRFGNSGKTWAKQIMQISNWLRPEPDFEEALIL